MKASDRGRGGLGVGGLTGGEQGQDAERLLASQVARREQRRAGPALQRRERLRRDPSRVGEPVQRTVAERGERLVGADRGQGGQQRCTRARDAGPGDVAWSGLWRRRQAAPRASQGPAPYHRRQSSTFSITRSQAGGWGSAGRIRWTARVPPSTTLASAGTGAQPARANACTSAAISLAHPAQSAASSAEAGATARRSAAASCCGPAGQVGNLVAGLVQDRGGAAEVVPGELDGGHRRQVRPAPRA